MATVRAKFRVNAITKRMGSHRVRDAEGNYVKDDRGYEKSLPCEVTTISMSPVYGNNDPKHENSKFWDASPSGQLELGCINPAASKCFELDQEYYIDFTPAD